MGRLWPILAIGFAILSLLLLIVLLWPSGGEDATTSSAEDSAELSCQMIAESRDSGLEDLSEDEQWIQMNRLGAAAQLAWVAEAQDPGFTEFRQAVERPNVAAARMFTLDAPEVSEALEAAEAACADLGH